MHHHRFASATVLTLLLLSALPTGCTSERHTSSETQTVVDALQRDVRVPAHIDRLVTLAPGVTEIVVAAGGLDRIVGVTDADDYPASVFDLPMFSALPVNFEAIAALEPDVVLATTQVNNRRDIEMFETLGIPIVFLASGSIEDVFNSVTQVGQILNTASVAETEVSQLRIRVDEVRATSNRRDSLSVLFLISAETLHSFGPESYVHELIELSGGRSITAGLNVVNPVLSDEFVLSANPDIIVGTFGEIFSIDALLDYHPTWTLVEAVQSERVFSIDADLILRAGPRIVDGAEELSSLLQRD